MKKNNAGSISITLDMESGKMQRQLRAIAKHTEALANELREIDKEECPECGSEDTEIIAATVVGPGPGEYEESKTFICYACNYTNGSF